MNECECDMNILILPAFGSPPADAIRLAKLELFNAVVELFVLILPGAVEGVPVTDFCFKNVFIAFNNLVKFCCVAVTS